MPILDRFKDIYPSEYLRRFGWMRLWLALQMSIGMFMLSTNVFSADINIYVSPSGDDHRSGNLPVFSSKNQDGPVATLTRARDRVRELRKHGGSPRATIFLRAGRYFMNEPLVLGNEDSGSLGSPLLITGYKGERVILTGAVPVQKFSPYQGEILSADLDPAKFKGRKIRQLFFDGKAQTLARYPNVDPLHPISGGWAYVDGTISSNQLNRPVDSKRELDIKPSDLRSWPSVEGGEIFIFARYNWMNDIIPVATFERSLLSKGGLLKLGADATYDIRPGDRYFVQNLLSELDSPGEWYFDAKTARLFFWPTKKIANDSSIVVSNLESLFDVSNAQFIHVRGLDIAIAEGAAIKLNNSSHCLIAANTIRYAGLRGRGTYAVAVTGGKDNQVIGNDISNIGGGGIFLSGGDLRTLTASNHLADNNVIHHTGEVYKQGVAIELAGVGNVVRHNLISDLPRMGILVAGNDHLIELNRIRYTNLETADSGAIYTSGRDWLSPRGVVIKNNEILDSIGYGFDPERQKWKTNYFAFGIYLDDNSSGVDIIGNIIGRSSWAGVLVHGGTYNNIVNNIIFDAGSDQVYFLGFGNDDPFRKLARKNQAEFSQNAAWQKYRGFACCSPDTVRSLSNNVFEKNIVVYSGKKNKYVTERLLPSEGGRINDNVIHHRDGDVIIDDGGESNGQSWARWQKRGFDVKSKIADPGLSDGLNGSIVLSKSSVALSMGFKPIPADKIGPYQSKYRATWPIREVESVRENLQ